VGVTSMEKKTFRDLESGVWATGLCSGCGACVAVCPADALRFAPGDNTAPVNIGYCKAENDSVPCGACYAACPRVDLAAQGRMLGSYLNIVAARSVPGRAEAERRRGDGVSRECPRRGADRCGRHGYSRSLDDEAIFGSDHLRGRARAARREPLRLVVPLLASLRKLWSPEVPRIAVVGVPVRHGRAGDRASNTNSSNLR
jgi:coenzyme F420 hydrogenase subunit beta